MQPASGRTLFPLASGGSIPLFEAALAAFAEAVGAGPGKPIVLVVDRAGWHTRRRRRRVPDQVHRLFRPPYGPALNPARSTSWALWPLTNTVLANRHATTRDDVEDAQAKRCVAGRTVPARRDRVHATTCFPWWPQRLRTLQHSPPRRE